ncbi:hypothetical protein C0J52_15406 [Blattella germanica]|nr:hypothetical protein C0J52_15406 [Blattella germanica]
MKKIEIRDDDDILFGCTLIPELLNHCKKITKEMRRMVKQQTKSFWIRFATSFRTYFLRNEISMLYYEKSEEEKVIQEQAFINILKMLTENNK